MAVEFDSTTSEVFKMHLLQGMQDAVQDVSFARQSMRLNHIAGVINQEEALGTRLVTESGSGITRDLKIS